MELSKIKDKTDFDYIKEYEDNADLDYYLSEKHWNRHVNSLLYKNIRVFHNGQEVGAFLNPSRGKNYMCPIKDYSILYGNLFNEAYRICNDVLRCEVPETKVAHFAEEAAGWKFRNLTDNEGNSLKLVPNVTDLIESYHILGMVNAILYFANCDERKVDDFLLALSIYRDEGLYFCMYIHCFKPYNDTCQDFICTTIRDGSYLRPGYDLKAKHEHMYATFPWYKKLSDILDKGLAEREAQKLKEQQEAAKPKDNVKKKVCKTQKKPAEDIKPKTLKYYKHGNKGVLQRQKHRVDILFKKFQEWKWIKDTSAQDFDSFFEGEPRHCNITWNTNATILTTLLQVLLKQPYIQKQVNCKTSTLVTGQFGLTPSYDRKKRVGDMAEERIKLVIYILNINNPLPERNREYSQEEDTTDEALKAISSGLRITRAL